MPRRPQRRASARARASRWRYRKKRGRSGFITPALRSMRRASVPLSARAPTCPRSAGFLAAARAAGKARGGGLHSGSSVKPWRARRPLDGVMRRRSRSAGNGECVVSDARAGAAAVTTVGVSQTVTSGSRLMPASKKRGHLGDSKVGACEHPPCAGRLAAAHVEVGRVKPRYASSFRPLSAAERFGPIIGWAGRGEMLAVLPARMSAAPAGKSKSGEVGVWKAGAGKKAAMPERTRLSGEEASLGVSPRAVRGLTPRKKRGSVPAFHLCSRDPARVARASFGVLSARLTIRKPLCKSAEAAGGAASIDRRRLSSARRGRARRAGARRRPARRSGRALPGPTRRRSSRPNPPCRRARCGRRGGRSPRPTAAGRS